MNKIKGSPPPKNIKKPKVPQATFIPTQGNVTQNMPLK